MTEDYLSFLKRSHCKVFLHSAHPVPLARSVLQNISMRTLVVSPLDDYLKDVATQHFPYSKTFVEAREDPFAIVNSTGSTGVPKLIQLTHGSVAAMARFQDCPKDRPTVFHLWSGLRLLLSTPVSLAIGVFFTLSTNLYFNWTIVLPPPLPLTAELLDSIHKHANVQVSISLPTVYPDLTKNDGYLGNLSRLQYVAYTGGPCSSEVGSIIAAKARLTTSLGSSETGPIPTECTDADDWEYTKFSPSLPHRLELACEDLYELVIVRDDDDSSNSKNGRNLQPVFCTFPDLAEYRTRDLYSKHPTKDNVWLYRGRRDDLIELSGSSSSSPRLIFPVPMERAIMSIPEIRFAIVYGTDRIRPALLVEPSEPCLDSEHETRTRTLVEDAVWPRVQEANRGYPPHGQILRNMIQVTKPSRPMSITTKGYVSRKRTIQLYQADLDALYNKEDFKVK